MFSPVHRIGKTTYALKLGEKLAKIGDNPFAMCDLAPFSTVNVTEFNGKNYEETVYDFDISENVTVQAYRNIYDSRRYETFNDDFKNLVLGKFGKLPASPSPEFIKEICGEEPLVLVRPADLLDPELVKYRQEANRKMRLPLPQISAHQQYRRSIFR